MRRIPLLTTLAASAALAAVLPATVLAPTGSEAAALARADFDRLKALAGDWCVVGEDGAVADESTWSFRVTAGGNAVLETMFIGSQHEMITVYHIDGDALALTHYCVVGNQPHMHALPDQPEDVLAFECTGAAGLASPDEAHMHRGQMKLLGKDEIQTEWRMFQGEENVHTASFHLKRQGRELR